MWLMFYIIALDYGTIGSTPTEEVSPPVDSEEEKELAYAAE